MSSSVYQGGRLTRGLRNNNPGNIRLGGGRFQGEVHPSRDPEFKEFETIEWGYRAMFVIIHNYDELYNINTLDKIIARWAPPVENDTQGYVRNVAKCMGLNASSYIDSMDGDQMTRLVGAMSYIETGFPANEVDINRGWEVFIG